MKYVFFISITAFILLYVAEDGPQARPHALHTRTIAPDDSEDVSVHDDSLTARERERRTTARERTLYDLDSLYKGVNLWIVPGPGETANNPAAEQLTNEYVAPNWVFQDSAFVYKGDECIQVLAYWGDSPWDPDTVVWTDICHPKTCFDSVTVPLGCWTETTTYIQDTSTQRICDTICTQTITYKSQLLYGVWSNLGMTNLVNLAMGGCRKYPTPPSSFYTYIKFVLYAGQWYQLSDTAQYHHFVPAADSCYIMDGDLAYFLSLANAVYSPFAGQGPWWVDSTETLTGTLPVPCELYGQPGVTRTPVNCRDTLFIVKTSVTKRVWQDAGKDTTIWTDTCDCYIPEFICATEYDTIWGEKYIYEYIYTRDSVQCEKEYQIPIYDVFWQYPTPRWEICKADPELDTTYAQWLTLRWLYGTSSRTSATQRHVRLLPPTPGKDSCWSWSCQTLEDVPPVGASDWWIEQSKIDSVFPCPGPICNADSVGSYTLKNWCCSKDTTVSFACYFEDEAMADTITRTYKIPDRTGACNQWTYTDWVKTDSTLIDSIDYIVRIEISTYYQLSYVDTCCHTPTFNGQPFCDLWVIDDCGRQWYQDSEGRWHIPCPEEDKDGDGLLDGTDYKFITDADAWNAHKIDSVRRHLESLEHNDLPGIQGGSSGEYYHMTSAEYTDFQANTAWRTSAKTADFTAANHTVYLVNATSGDVVVTLPTHAAALEFVVKRTDAAANAVTLSGTIDGSENPTVASLKAYRIISDGAAWHFIGQY